MSEPEQEVGEALRAHRLRQLVLELEAFGDPAHVAEVARLGDEGLEDIHGALGRMPEHSA